MGAQAKKGNPGQRASAGNLGRLPGGGGIGTGLKRWVEIEEGRREKSISNKRSSINKSPEVGQVEEQTVA